MFILNNNTNNNTNNKTAFPRFNFYKNHTISATSYFLLCRENNPTVMRKLMLSERKIKSKQIHFVP